MADVLLNEIRDNVMWLTLNRAEARNALSADIISGLREAAQEARRDDAVRVVVITGTDPAFSAGGDVKEMGKLLASGTVDPIKARALVAHFHEMVADVYELDKPVICAVNGVSVGAGCNLALLGDMRIASDEATFRWAFIHRGLSSDAGSTFLLQRLVGYSKAFELLTLAEKIDAAEALRIGVVDRVVPHAKLLEATAELAAGLAAGPPNAISMIKRSLQAAATLNLRDSLAMEENLQALAMGGAEFQEGVRSFLEKRAPKF
jgi:2-(1,2-epoxy-1,2-dihydrophenyl)acetyl-CoA isomerase